MYSDDLVHWELRQDRIESAYLIHSDERGAIKEGEILHLDLDCAEGAPMVQRLTVVPGVMAVELFELARQHANTDGFAPIRRIGWCEDCAVRKVK